MGICSSCAKPDDYQMLEEGKDSGNTILVDIDSPIPPLIESDSFESGEPEAKAD